MFHEYVCDKIQSSNNYIINLEKREESFIDFLLFSKYIDVEIADIKKLILQKVQTMYSDKNFKDLFDMEEDVKDYSNTNNISTKAKNQSETKKKVKKKKTNSTISSINNLNSNTKPIEIVEKIEKPLEVVIEKQPQQQNKSDIPAKSLSNTITNTITNSNSNQDLKEKIDLSTNNKTDKTNSNTKNKHVRNSSHSSLESSDFKISKLNKTFNFKDLQDEIIHIKHALDQFLVNYENGEYENNENNSSTFEGTKITKKDTSGNIFIIKYYMFIYFTYIF